MSLPEGETQFEHRRNSDWDGQGKQSKNQRFREILFPENLTDTEQVS